ncbi:MAG: hypothetical protein DI527_16255 [Chelatococcus sp.]|nr:MAG: hypothetical protein DI527_16255 [Chelatococcus sp.]
MSEAALQSFIRIVESVGPIGAIVIAVVVALALAWLLLSRGTQQQQATEFQGKLLAALEAMTKAEAASRAALQEAMAENEALRRNVSELTTSVDLLRAQMRHMLAMLRDLQAGRIAPGEIRIPGEPT